MRGVERIVRALQRVPTSKARWSALIGGLSISAAAAATGFTAIGGFGGQLFGLTAGQGQLLVADASVGIVPVRHGVPRSPIPLLGVNDMSVGRGGVIWAVTGAIGPPPQGPQNDTGQGLHLIERGKVTKIVNLFEYEATYNPHTGAPPNPPDSNPYDVEAYGADALVVDAGGNDLLRIDRRGRVNLLAVFPDELVSTANIKSLAGCPGSGASFCSLPDSIPGQAVPTSIAVDRHGYIYVGELKGFPAPAGASNIWRISPHAKAARCGESPHCVKVFNGGFTSIIDMAFGPDGLLYVAELDEGSWAAIDIFQTPKGGTINACSVIWRICFEVEDDLPQPTALTFDKGRLWATQNALTPGSAEVVSVGGRRFGWGGGWLPRLF